MRSTLVRASEIPWSQRELDRILDSPDGHGPPTHFQNPRGEPLYDRERVRVAGWRIGRGRRPRLSAERLSWWARAEKPTSAPVLVVDFHRLAEAHWPEMRRLLWNIRVSREEILEDALTRLVGHSLGRTLTNWQEARDALQERAGGAVKRLGEPWPNVILRRAHRSSYIPRATGSKVLNRALDALAVVGEGVVPIRAFLKRPTFADLLTSVPILRFDPLE